MNQIGKILSAIIEFILAIVLLILAGDFLLKLLAAKNGEFTQFVKDAANPFSKSFRNIFDNIVIDRKYVIDTADILAMIVITLVGVIVLEFIRYVTKEEHVEERTVIRTRK